MKRLFAGSLVVMLAFAAMLFYPYYTPAVVNKTDASKVGHIRKVVVLSNSILRHSPAPQIGWYGDWGMAASCPDSDFYHRLIRDIHSRDSGVTITSGIINRFEWIYPTYALSNYDSFRNADMYIIKLSENVDDRKAIQQHFIDHYDKLLNYLDPQHHSVMVIVEGFWKKGYRWPQPWVKADVNAMIRNYAIRKHYPFIPCAYLFRQAGNTARGLYKDYGIGNHPSDQGMRRIEENIWNYIQAYFPERKSF